MPFFMQMRSSLAAALVLAAFCTAATSAAAPSHRAVHKLPPDLHDRSSVTHHRIVVGGVAIDYTATAGTITLTDKKDKPEASVFYVAYTKDGADRTRRPVTFIYNGGP